MSRQRVVVWIALLAVVTVFVRQIDDFDLWYHLVIGRGVWDSGRIPPTEFFVYTLAGQPAWFHEWGFGLLFFLIYRTAGFWGMAGLNAALAGIALLAAYRAARREGGSEAIYLAGLGVLASLIYYRVAYRPETMLFAALAASLYALERHATQGRTRWLAVIPAVVLLLSQTHPSAIFILFVTGCYGLQAIVNDRAAGGSGRRPALRFLGVTVAAAVGACLNPYGWRQLLLPFSFATEISSMGIMEFTPTWLTGYRWPLVAIALAGAGGALTAPRRGVASTLIWMAFGFLAFRHVRNVALFALVVYLPVTRGLDALVGRMPRLAWFRGPAATAIAATLTVTVPWTTALNVGVWGAGPREGVFPEVAARTIEGVHPEGRLFNLYDYGGYLAWRLFARGYPVSIDGRHFVRDSSLILHNEVFFEGGRWRERFDAFDVAAVVTRATSPFSGRLVLLVAELDADPEWDLVSVEPAGLLFVRRSRCPPECAALAMDKNEIWRQAARETEAVASRFPDHAWAHQTLGVAAFKLGLWPEAAAGFRRYLELRPGDGDTQEIVVLLEAASRGDTAAGERLKRLRARGRSL